MMLQLIKSYQINQNLKETSVELMIFINIFTYTLNTGYLPPECDYVKPCTAKN